MSDIINFEDHAFTRKSLTRKSEPRLSGTKLREMREEYGILRRQLADQLDVSVATIERWEKSDRTTVTQSEIGAAISIIRVVDPNFNTGKNLCFGRFSIRYAREILGLTQEQMAAEFVENLSHWKKIESHERKISDDVLAKVEQSIRDSVSIDCP